MYDQVFNNPELLISYPSTLVLTMLNTEHATAKDAYYTLQNKVSYTVTGRVLGEPTVGAVSVFLLQGPSDIVKRISHDAIIQVAVTQVTKNIKDTRIEPSFEQSETADAQHKISYALHGTLFG